MMVWPAVIGAVGSLAGGLLSSNANKKAAQSTNAQSLAIARENNEMQQGFFDRNFQQSAEQFATNVGQNDRNFRRSAYEANRAFSADRQDAARSRADQERFAKHSTGWAFKDLMKAADASGIHRLAAIGGAQGANYSPVQGQGAATAYQGSSPPSGGSQLPSASSPSLETAFMGDIIGPAVARVAQGYENKLKRERNADANNLQKAAVQMEMEESRARTALLNAQATTVIRNAKKLDDPVTQLGDAPSPRNPSSRTDRSGGDLYIGGEKLTKDTGTSDQEAFERRYGEVVGNAAGAEIARRDFVESSTYDKILAAFPNEMHPRVKVLLGKIRNQYLRKSPRRSKTPKKQPKFKVNRGSSRLPRNF
ncbi:hypothetical protein [Microviridae sp.]|nr:hypothetical protein [Microviridae sp.]